MPDLRLHNGRFPLPLLLSLLFIALALTTGSLQAQDPILPAAPPDAATGLEIFAARCANCHGPAGQGDGDLAARLPLPPADYTDPDFRFTRVPATMFNAITNGIIQGGMPPFGPLNTESPISEANRWDLVAAIYSLATPPETLEFGGLIYEESCAACHGAAGLGDGPEAADQETPPTDLTSLSYWYNRSNETVFTALENGRFPAHDYNLTDAELLAVTDYSRAFSYRFSEPVDLAAPIAAATISGVLTNGTTGQLIRGGDVILRAFTPSLQTALTLTETVGSDGEFFFNFSDAQPDWIYLASVVHEGLGFSSDAARLDPANPFASLPIIVYDQTTDPAGIVLDQVHILLNFSGDTVQVDELYMVSNQDNRVFAGETGNVADGVFQISLPEGATNVTFQRSLGRMDSAIPAPEIIRTADGWADVMPLTPGPSGQSLIVSYDLPYNGGATLDRLVHYPISNVGVILTAGGVTLQGEGFMDQGVQQMGTSQFVAYTRTGVPPQNVLAMSLSGRPDFTMPQSAAGGQTAVITQPLNPTFDWLIGGLALLVVGITAVFTIRAWRNHTAEAEEAYEDETALLRQRLIQTIADLDADFQAGNLDEATYARQRAALTADLAAIWQH
jgi:mono/diheme cytochrome c family protein